MLKNRPPLPQDHRPRLARPRLRRVVRRLEVRPDGGRPLRLVVRGIRSVLHRLQLRNSTSGTHLFLRFSSYLMHPVLLCLSFLRVVRKWSLMSDFCPLVDQLLALLEYKIGIWRAANVAYMGRQQGNGHNRQFVHFFWLLLLYCFTCNSAWLTDCPGHLTSDRLLPPIFCQAAAIGCEYVNLDVIG